MGFAEYRALSSATPDNCHPNLEVLGHSLQPRYLSGTGLNIYLTLLGLLCLQTKVQARLRLTGCRIIMGLPLQYAMGQGR